MTGRVLIRRRTVMRPRLVMPFVFTYDPKGPVAVIVICQVCGVEFEAAKRSAKTCGATCRQRLKRGTTVSAGSSTDGLVEALRAELEDAGRLDTVAGQLAVFLAEQMTAAGATGVATLSKEFRTVKAEALAGVVRGPVVEDEVDRARRAREDKRRNAAIG